VVDYLPNPTQKECAALNLDAGEQREVLQVRSAFAFVFVLSAFFDPISKVQYMRVCVGRIFLIRFLIPMLMRDRQCSHSHSCVGSQRSRLFIHVFTHLHVTSNRVCFGATLFSKDCVCKQSSHHLIMHMSVWRLPSSPPTWSRSFPSRTHTDSTGCAAGRSRVQARPVALWAADLYAHLSGHADQGT
jgi:hypothetical protein